MKVVVLTTSYPTSEHPVAGSFVASYVDAAREAGIEASVVAPGDFPHFGVALGAGIAQNLRAQPWRVPLIPAFLASYSLAARRAASGADVVHAHWLPSAIAARAVGKPYVLQVWGTDMELARHFPSLARPLLRSARVVVAASEYLAAQAWELGARDVEVIPPPLAAPAEVAEPDEPAHVLFAGRLSEEKGILEFLEATDGLPRVIVGDGPLRERVRDALGFVAPSEMGLYYERAAVVAVPSRREGYGMTAREALAYGRPVVATSVGGLGDLTSGVIHVPPRDPRRLRDAIEALLADRGRRAALGAEGRRASPLASDVAARLRALYERVR